MLRTLAVALSLATLAAACGQPGPAPPEAPPAVLGGAGSEPTPEAIAARVKALPPPYNEGDYDNGRVAFNQCRSCHVVAAGAKDGLGPNLYGVFGRTAGKVEGFAYSPALRSATLVWDGESLEQWLANPRTFLPGNRMSFAGLRNPEARRDLITYLQIESAPE